MRIDRTIQRFPGRYFIILVSLQIVQTCSPPRIEQIPNVTVEFPDDITVLTDTSALDLHGRSISRLGQLGAGTEYIYVFDRERAVLIQMNRSFHSIQEFGGFGQRPGEFSRNVRQIMVTNEHVIAIDAGNVRAIFHAHDGRFVAESTLEGVPLANSPFVWDETKSCLYYLPPSSLKSESMRVAAVEPFPRLFRQRQRNIFLQKQASTPSDIACTVLAGIRSNMLYLVDNYVDSSPSRQIGYEIYSLGNGTLVTKGDLLDDRLLTEFTDQFDDYYWRTYERTRSSFDLILRPFTLIWLVNDHLMMCFTKLRQVEGRPIIEPMAVDLVTGDIRPMGSDLWKNKDVLAMAGAVDSTLYVAYRLNDELRFMSARLVFPPSPDSLVNR